MKIIRQSDKQVFDYTCEEVRQKNCTFCKTVYEFTDSDCDVIQVQNPFYFGGLQQQNSLQYNQSGIPPIFVMPMYSRRYVCCPWCGKKEEV